MKREIKKVLIANRGEIAVRIIRACQEMGIGTVAIYSDADRTSPHVLMADQAYRIGPAPSRESYLVTEKILEIATLSGADAIHPGYGFLSENASFASRVLEAGIEFIGPRPESIHTMGDKTEARKVVSAAGVPTVPGTADAVSDEKLVRDFAREFGYPILIKAAAGGGGKGMRVVSSESQLAAAFAGAQSEALSAFGDGRVYVEKYLERPRHIEFQILADKYGNTIHLGERECSIQRRHQKVVEETPSVIVDDDLRSRMGRMAVAAARACKYENAGTIECLVDKDRNFYFLEMNTRLQVEHPVTEMRTGIDIVHQQLRIAMGERLAFAQGDVQFRGHAIECRIYAEDPFNNFLPSTGTITHLKPSQGFGIREDRGVEQGGEISVYYDPMISKLVAHAQTRDDAILKLKRALHEYEILGVRVNIPFNLFVLDHPCFRSGEFDTHFVATHFRPELLRQASESDNTAAALVTAMLEDGRVHSTSTSNHNQNNSVSINGVGSKWKTRRLDYLR
ncbi:MAG: acetyl-CoA carboxylase biotin carboxylase subunit [Ignavibacteriae bacterium]|nr:acetyl-CoA carboxylase biotin carboxylase subunit [Ignavibacteriota bacterium]